MFPPPGLKGAKQILRPYGMTITKRESEYRVAFVGNYVDVEPSAYYTDDLGDAVITGIFLSKQRSTRND